MEGRKVAVIIAAGLASGLMGSAAAAASIHRTPDDVTVTGQRLDTKTQRAVSYSDLNLALVPDQKILRGRIGKTAKRLCFDLNGVHFPRSCSWAAVRSTDDQVEAAIRRAELKMAGKAVGPPIVISMAVGGR